ncbi:MAG: helix-turn-helix domain-containing protein [Duodenibacillus sp.]|nr:helix-turn-helix domain-containing protein [Duodenibacillus sp.]
MSRDNRFDPSEKASEYADAVRNGRQAPPAGRELSSRERFEVLAGEIRQAFSLPLTFSDPDLASLAADQYFGVRLQSVSSCFAGYIESTAYSARMSEGSRREESVSLVFVMSGTMSLSQNSNFGTMRPGEAYLFNAASPAQFTFHTPFKEVVVGIPKGALSAFVPDVDRYTATALPMTPGLELLRSLAFSAASSGTQGSVPAAALGHLSDAFLSLAGTSLAQVLPGNRSVPQREGLLLLVQDSMRRNLGDPDLSPARIAAANRLSERSLYELFRQNGLSVMDWLWEARLSRARELLANPNCIRMSAAEVAYACGFKNAAHFSTRFKKAFGMTPVEYRERQLTQSAPTPGRT